MVIANMYVSKISHVLDTHVHKCIYKDSVRSTQTIYCFFHSEDQRVNAESRSNAWLLKESYGTNK
jgi:hypothetical protein